MLKKNNDCPCAKDCPDRWVSLDGDTARTCHGTCPKYKEWTENRAAKKKAQAVLAERYAMTNSKRKALWAHCRRDCSGAKKKFSQ